MKHATCALTVTASGKMITPLFVFKGKNIQLIVGMMKCFPHFIVLLLGKPNGRIVQCEFPTYAEGMIYACQDNAWMGERLGVTGFYPSPKSFWSCTHVNSCQKYILYINIHIL